MNLTNLNVQNISYLNLLNNLIRVFFFSFGFFGGRLYVSIYSYEIGNVVHKYESENLIVRGNCSSRVARQYLFHGNRQSAFWLKWYLKVAVMRALINKRNSE